MCAKRKSKTKKWIVISIITIAVASTTTALLLKPSSMPYETVTADIRDITTYYSFSGNVETKNRQTVMSERVMQVSEIKVKEGDAVKEGTVLIKTTSRDEIKAKINGEVTNINIEENAQVMAGTKLLEIVDYNNLEVIVKVDEYDIAALEKAKEATVKIGAIDKEISGTVSSVSKEGKVINGMTYFTSTIDLKKDKSLKIGMSAEVKLTSNKAVGIVTLPMAAIQFDDNNKPYVLKKGAKSTVVRTDIITGINDGMIVEIKSGVIEGETIFYTKTKASATRDFDFPRGRSITNSGRGEE